MYLLHEQATDVVILILNLCIMTISRFYSHGIVVKKKAKRKRLALIDIKQAT